MSREEVAQLIERFLERRNLYPQEWNDFVDTPQQDDAIERYRRQCYELDPLINRLDVPASRDVAGLQELVESLRSSKL